MTQEQWEEKKRRHGREEMCEESRIRKGEVKEWKKRVRDE